MNDLIDTTDIYCVYAHVSMVLQAVLLPLCSANVCPTLLPSFSLTVLKTLQG